MGLCLDQIGMVNLSLVRHVQRKHKTIYAQSKKKKAKDFIAKDGQTIPDDTEY